MKIGLAKVCITPNLPIYLSGFATVREAEGKLDDLYVKVIVWKKKDAYVGVLAYDVIAIDDLIINGVKEEMLKENISCENFIFSATHTHSGPGGIVETTKGLLQPAADIFVRTDLDIINGLVEKSVCALRSAISDCQEAELTYARDILEDVGSNRNGQQFDGNHDIIACFIKQQNGKQAVLLNYACHPTVLNGTNKMMSADFPGACDSFMQEHHVFMSVFFNGSCGDISTRFTRQKSDASEVLRYGKQFEKKLIKMKQTAKPFTIDQIQIEHRICTLSLKKVDSIKHAQAEVDICEKRLLDAQRRGISGSKLRLIESYKEGAQANLRLSKYPFLTHTFDVKLSFYKVNQHIFVCVPGELFSELSNPLQNENVHFIGYANGYLGYFAHELAYNELYYEALSSPFEKGQSEYMMKFIKKEIENLRKGSLI